jgi:hypothetical protein
MPELHNFWLELLLGLIVVAVALDVKLQIRFKLKGFFKP